MKRCKTKIILVNLNWHRKDINYHNIDKKSELYLDYPDWNIDDYLIKIININLDIYQELCYHNIKESDKLWKLLTINEEEQLNLITKDEKLLHNYKNKILYLSNSEEYKKMIMNEDIERNALWEQNHGYDFDKGVQAGREKGTIEGKLNAKKEMIINMYKNGISIDLISECSKMPIDEVENIINDKYV